MTHDKEGPTGPRNPCEECSTDTAEVCDSCAASVCLGIQCREVHQERHRLPCSTCGRGRETEGDTCNSCWSIEGHIADYLRHPRGREVVATALRATAAPAPGPLEVATRALERIRDWSLSADGSICNGCARLARNGVVSHASYLSCGEASSALAALRGMVGAGKDPPAEEGVDLSRCGGCGDRCGVWREDRALGPNDPSAWIREPGIWVFDCKNQDPRDEIKGGAT